MADQNRELRPAARQELSTVLSTEQRHSLELLQYSAMELEQYLTQVASANPLLDEETAKLEVPSISVQNADNSTADKEDENQIEAETVENADFWADELPIPEHGGSGVKEDVDPFLRSIAPPPTPEEQLMQELELDKTHSQIEFELARFIVETLDEYGFLSLPLADVAMICNSELEEAQRALQWVQSLDPPGIGARNLSESLELQLKRFGQWTPLYHQLLTTGAEMLERNQLPQLAKHLQITMDDLAKLLENLRSLDPAPGRVLDLRPVITREAELEIFYSNDEYSWQVKLLNERVPKFVLSERYIKLLEDSTISSETKQYLQEKLTQAQELLRALERRGSTLLNLGKLLISQQSEFLDKGVKYLRPMTMKQAGEMLQVHESTISRAVADKFIITPRGTFPLKFFFTAGFIEKEGEIVSTHTVMSRIKELIADEDPNNPLSDKELTIQLNLEGYALKPRTVSKYREALKIPRSSMRKKHF